MSKKILQSHHLYPNTITDYEISGYNRLFNWMPVDKSFKEIAWAYIVTPFVYGGLFHFTMITR